MIKGALFDVDDTLFSHKTHRVPSLTMKALKKLRDKGIKIGICTSREVGEMYSIPKDLLDLLDCQIAATGAVSFVKDKYYKGYTLDKDVVRKYIDYFDKNNISYHFSDLNGDSCYWGDKSLVEDGFLMKMCKGHVYYQQYEDEDITNLCFYNVSDEQLEHIKSINPKAYLSLWGHSGHIAPNFVDKGFGLLKFCEIFGFTSDEVLACGDGSNDDLMLEMAGLSIATDDAKENTKLAADYVCSKSIDDGGIYEALIELKVIGADPRNIKAFFFDNDSTIFNHSGKGEKILPSTIEALKKLRKNGYKVCMITSRGYDEMCNVPNDVKVLFDDLCLLSGAYNVSSDGNIDMTPMDKKCVIGMINKLDTMDVTYRYATSDGGGYINRHEESKEDIFRRLYEMVPSVKKYEGEDVYHLLAYISKEDADKMYEDFKNIEYSHVGTCAEYSPLNVDKGWALQKMCKKYGISLDEACAFGDSGNDIPMFNKAGLAICLGNGSNVAKEYADYITDNIFEDGLEKALKHFNYID